MLKFFRMIGLMFIITAFFFMVGCTNNGGGGGQNPPDDNPTDDPSGDPHVDDRIAPTELEVYNVDGKRVSLYYYGDEIELAVDVEPSDASYDVTWTSSDDSIAQVNDQGVVKIVGTGDFTITATSQVDTSVSASWSKKAYDNRSDKATIEDTKTFLSGMFGDDFVLEGFLELPASFGDASITWDSSNKEVMSNDGYYSRQDTDVTVTMTAKILVGRTIDTWTKDIVVGNINDMQMRTIKPGKLVMMYVYQKSGNYTQYELENVDIINHAFALINPSTYTINMTNIERSAASILKARSYGIRVCLSIGGWGADGFSQSCLNDERRSIFVKSIIDAVKKYGYDGVDLDWEYPGSGSAQIAYASADKKNFTKLVQELRTELNKIRPGMLLTAAVASETTYYEVSELNKYLDYWNIMTYDFSSKHTGDTAKYDEPLDRSKTAINKFISAGASKNKIVFGVTFRGVLFKVASLGSSDKFGFGEKMQAERIDVDYSDIVSKYRTNSAYEYVYDSTSGMGILYTPSKHDGVYEIMAFNDAKTMQAKGKFVTSQGLAGIMAWELGMDDKNNTILKLTVNSLK